MFKWNIEDFDGHMLPLHLSYYNIIKSDQVTGVLSALRFVSILAIFGSIII